MINKKALSNSFTPPAGTSHSFLYSGHVIFEHFFHPFRKLFVSDESSNLLACVIRPVVAD